VRLGEPDEGVHPDSPEIESTSPTDRKATANRGDPRLGGAARTKAIEYFHIEPTLQFRVVDKARQGKAKETV
jgi:hypothetical protein